MTEQAFTPMSKFTLNQIEHIFWSMKDSKNEEKALEVLASLGLNPFERLALVVDLRRFGKLALEEQDDVQ